MIKERVRNIETIQLSYPWWYSFIKWLLPIGLAALTATVVGLSLLGILPIPAAFGMAAWAPVFFSQLGPSMAVGVFIVSTGIAASLVGAFAALITRGLLLHTAEKVAEHRAIQIAQIDSSAQTKQAEHTVALQQREMAIVEGGEAHGIMLTKYNQLVGYVAGFYQRPAPAEEDILEARERRQKTVRFTTTETMRVPGIHIIEDNELQENQEYTDVAQQNGPSSLTTTVYPK